MVTREDVENIALLSKLFVPEEELDSLTQSMQDIINFADEINNAPAGEVIANPETVLYAFANAIIDSCTEDRITGVRVRIKGSTDIRFRDQVNLDQVFSRNADVIYTPVVKLDESEPAA